MSYQVLARKWRPRIFREMVGQEHVLKALINALDHNRLHHAYLFTGTRGVGKTTIARILAKCLNCETGVSSEPCGQCSSCQEIAEGRFVDLIEVDAASRTRVEDTRELLDNVQYAPTRGRYKIYLIDEVHMLSTHSFNALLKTLEEPPEHVKFLLATTDPQKLPVTILSRCLQFNLKNMSPERIVGHLQFVLGKEVIPFEETALWQLARSADGSMRDALSLTDQAIAYGGGKVSDADVVAMLGTIDHRLIEKLIRALIMSDGAGLLAAVAEFSEHAPDYASALGDLITFLHRLAIAQAMPEALDNSYGDRSVILDLCQMLPPEDVQLFYQTALIGRRDLHLSPDPRAGLEMTLLRMLAFKPQGVVDVPKHRLPISEQGRSQSEIVQAPESNAPQDDSTAQSSPERNNSLEPNNSPEQNNKASASITSSPQNNPQEPVSSHPMAAEAGNQAPEAAGQNFSPTAQPVTQPSSAPPPWDDNPPQSEAADTAKKSLEALLNAPGLEGLKPAPEIAAPASKHLQSKHLQPELIKPEVVEAEPSIIYDAPRDVEHIAPEHWLAVYHALGVKGVLQSTVANSVLVRREGNQLFFWLDQNKGALFDESHKQRFNDLLNDYFTSPVKVHIELSELPPDMLTPAIDAEQRRQRALAEATEKIKNEPLVQALQTHFDGQLSVESVCVK